MVRLLVLGAAPTSLPTLIPRLNKILQTAGPFTALLLTTAPTSTLPTSFDPLLPTYFTAQHHNGSPTPTALSNNLHYVGPAATLHLSNIKITLLAADYPSPSTIHTFPAEIQSALNDAGTNSPTFPGIEVLLTGGVPTGIASGTDNVAATIGQLLRPKYHLCPGETFSETGPFLVEGSCHGTRVVCIGPAEDGRRKRGVRWAYAADVGPVTAGREGGVRTGEGYFGGVGSSVEGVQKRRRVGEKCWFCLTETDAKHLVVAMGEDVYVAIAKGAVTEGHVLIVGKEHVAGVLEAGEAVRGEVVKWMGRVERMFGQFYEGKKALFFERCVVPKRGKGVLHMHVQAVPVGSDVDAGKVLEKIAGECGVALTEVEGRRVESVRGAVEEDVDYFWAEVPGGKTFLHMMDRQVQESKERTAVFRIGRAIATQVVAGSKDSGLKGSRAGDHDWRNCVLSKEEEVQIATKVAEQLKQCG